MKLEYRHIINKKDNLEDVFSLIYEGDPYIYRDLFSSDFKVGYQVFLRICHNELCLFYLENYRVAVNAETQEIVGICSFFNAETRWIPAIVEQAYILCGVRTPDSFDSVSDYFNKTYNYKHFLVGACDICVKKEYRGQHIGDFILKELLEEIGNQDVQLTVLKDNIAAVKLYENNGFTKVWEFDDYGGHNAPKVACYVMYRVGDDKQGR